MTKPLGVRGLANTRLGMLDVRRELTTREDFAREIGRLWDQSLEAMVEIGRRLNEAKEQLAHGEFDAMVERDLPFSPATGRKLRQVAQFVDAEVLPKDQLPGSYSTVFLLSSLTPEELEQARSRGLVGPKVKRAELERFRAELRGPVLAAPTVAEDPDELIGLGEAGAPSPAPPAPVMAEPEVLPPAPAADRAVQLGRGLEAPFTEEPPWVPPPAPETDRAPGHGWERLLGAGTSPADDLEARKVKIRESIKDVTRQRDRLNRTLESLMEDLRRLDEETK